MRAVAVLTALVLLLAPLAAAQGDSDPSGSSSSSSSSSSPSTGPSDGGSNATDDSEDGADEVPCPSDRRPSTPAEQRACFCRENADRPVCGGDEGPSDEEAAGEWRRWCRAEAREDAQRERCRSAVSEFGGSDGRHVAFGVDAPNRTLLAYRIDGSLALEAIAFDTGSDNLTVHRAGSSLRLGDLDTELVLHDDPTGLVRFKGDDGSITLRLPASARIATDADGTSARVTYEDGRVGHVRAGNATWLDDHTVLAAGFAAFLLPPAEPRSAANSAGDGASDDDGDDTDAQEAEEEVGRAIGSRKVGAEISVSGPAPAAASMLAGEGDGTVEVLAYDDVDVEVNVPSAAATPDAPIRVKVSAELDEGRTIVLNLDESVLESAKARALVLRYYDLYEQPDGTEVQTEVLFLQADGGLQDILDPTDDSGQPEYWVVEDANGVQVLVSVPHWSAHAITIGSLLAQNPSVLFGILVGLSGTAVATAAMLWPRRRLDE
jgi:hypothetical protein